MKKSTRRSIVSAFVDTFKGLQGTAPYNIDLQNNVYPTLKFWDEVVDFPAVYVVAGSENREYLPGGFVWGYINVAIKAYTKGENSTDQLEVLLEDLETAIDATNGSLVYNEQGHETTQISITSITTDEGLLQPYAVGEVNLLVRYQVM